MATLAIWFARWWYRLFGWIAESKVRVVQPQYTLDIWRGKICLVDSMGFVRVIGYMTDDCPQWVKAWLNGQMLDAPMEDR